MASESLSRVLSSLKNQLAPESHMRRVEALRNLCEHTPGCIGLALVGSYAKNIGDRISDLDLIAFFDNGTAFDYLEKSHQLLTSEEILSAYSGSYRTEGGFRKYVFLDFSSCELHALNLPAEFKLSKPYVAIWDPADLLTTLETEGPTPRHEDFKAYQHGDDGLLWELFDCIKWMKRGRIELTKSYLRRLVKKLPPEDTSNVAEPFIQQDV